MISFHSGFFLFQTGPLASGKVPLFSFINLSSFLPSFLPDPLLRAWWPHTCIVLPSFLHTSEIQGLGSWGLDPGWTGDLDPLHIPACWPHHTALRDSVLFRLNANVCCVFLPWLAPASLSPSQSVALSPFQPGSWQNLLSHPVLFLLFSFYLSFSQGQGLQFPTLEMMAEIWIPLPSFSGSQLGDFAPQGTVGIFWRHFWLSWLRRLVLLGSKG